MFVIVLAVLEVSRRLLELRRGRGGQLPERLEDGNSGGRGRETEREREREREREERERERERGADIDESRDTGKMQVKTPDSKTKTKTWTPSPQHSGPLVLLQVLLGVEVLHIAGHDVELEVGAVVLEIVVVRDVCTHTQRHRHIYRYRYRHSRYAQSRAASALILFC